MNVYRCVEVSIYFKSTLPIAVGEDFWTRVDYESKRKLFFVVFFALNYGFDQYVPGVVRAIESQFVD